MLVEGHVGPSRIGDNTDGKLRLANDGSVVTNLASGAFYEHVLRGNGYSFTTALAGNALIAPGTANAPAIWNPPQSGRLLSIIKVAFGRTAKGTPLEGSIVYTRLQNVNSRLGTAADLVSGTAVAAVNLRSDLGDNSGMVFFPTTVVTTTTPTLWAASGIAQTADNGATTVSGPGTQLAFDDVNGLLVVGPGTLFSLAAAVSVSTTYTITIYGISIPIPLTA
jgi:hypothetical protein